MNLLIHLLIYNLAASVWLYGSLAYNPRMWLHRMPPEVRSKVPDKTPAERKLFIGVALPFLLLLFVYPIAYAIQQDTTLGATTWTLLAFFASFALWDTLVLDLLIFCKLTPRFVIIDGTTRADYSNMKYHLISGAKGLIMSVVFSGLAVSMITLVKNIIT
jgi:hypothetical protein